MSDTDTNEATEVNAGANETAKERKAREAAERATQGSEQGEEAKPDRAPRAKAPDTSTVSLDAINAAVLAAPDLVAATAPTRERSEQQKSMDAVAVKAYDAWIKAGRPSQWKDVPVVTYFLADEDVPKYRYLIRRACDIVEPSGGSIGVRVRFGNEFTLSEAMANRPEINRPEDAGKTVLAWAAIDKRVNAEKDSEK
jgi:hypothetical protein